MKLPHTVCVACSCDSRACAPITSWPPPCVCAECFPMSTLGWRSGADERRMRAAGPWLLRFLVCCCEEPLLVRLRRSVRARRSGRPSTDRSSALHRALWSDPERS